MEIIIIILAVLVIAFICISISIYPPKYYKACKECYKLLSELDYIKNHDYILGVFYNLEEAEDIIWYNLRSKNIVIKNLYCILDKDRFINPIVNYWYKKITKALLEHVQN